VTPIGHGTAMTNDFGDLFDPLPVLVEDKSAVEPVVFR